jgi:hypothetical protein
MAVTATAFALDICDEKSSALMSEYANLTLKLTDPDATCVALKETVLEAAAHKKQALEAFANCKDRAKDDVDRATQSLDIAKQEEGIACR